MSSQETITVYPESKESVGSSYWRVLFNSASQYPIHPSDQERTDINNYIKSTIKNFVCQDCIDHSFDYIRKHPIRNDNRESLMKYLCELKNNSNSHEGKDQIDCSDFIMKSLNNEKASCKSCSIERVQAPVTTIPSKKVENPAPPPTTTVVQQQVERYQPPGGLSPSLYNSAMGFTYGNMAKILDHYPNIKRALNLNDANAYQTQQSQAFIASQQQAVPPGGAVMVAAQPGHPGNPTQLNELAQRYPTLAGVDLNIDGPTPQEELEGILKALDPIYAFPASVVGIPASQMNLAYTPEMLSNSVSLLTQIYLTNAGSLLSSMTLSSILIGISIFMKNSIASYDRLFIQNVAGSLLFHSLNFMNPRSKDDIVPDFKKLFEGLTKGDFNVMKEALLFKSKDEANTADKSAKQLLNLIKAKKGIVDMKKLAENHNDLRHGHAFNSTGGTLTRGEYDALMDRGDGDPDVNYGSILDSSEEFDYMLESGI